MVIIPLSVISYQYQLSVNSDQLSVLWPFAVSIKHQNHKIGANQKINFLQTI